MRLATVIDDVKFCRTNDHNFSEPGWVDILDYVLKEPSVITGIFSETKRFRLWVGE